MRRKLKGGTSEGGTDRGLTLLELVVAVAVLSIGSIAAYRAMDQSGRAIGGALPRLLAQNAAQNRAEELRLLGPARAAALPASIESGPFVIALEVATETTAAGLVQAEIRATTAEGPGTFLVSFVPAEGAQ